MVCWNGWANRQTGWVCSRICKWWTVVLIIGKIIGILCDIAQKLWKALHLCYLYWLPLLVKQSKCLILKQRCLLDFLATAKYPVCQIFNIFYRHLKYFLTPLKIWLFLQPVSIQVYHNTTVFTWNVLTDYTQEIWVCLQNVSVNSRLVTYCICLGSDRNRVQTLARSFICRHFVELIFWVDTEGSKPVSSLNCNKQQFVNFRGAI